MGKEGKDGWVVENGAGGGEKKVRGLERIALREKEHKTARKRTCDVIRSALNSP